MAGAGTAKRAAVFRNIESNALLIEKSAIVPSLQQHR